MLMTTDDMMDEVAAHWSHDPGSVIYGLVDELNLMLEFGSDMADKMVDWHAIDYAEGTTLDLIAAQYDISRPDSDDEFLRFLIRLRKQVAKSDGTLNSIANIIAGSLEVDLESIQILTTRNGDGNVNHITVKGIPEDKVSDDREKGILLDNLKVATMLGVYIDEIAYRAAIEANVYVGVAFQSQTKYEIESEEVSYG